jgi:molybdopterin synthase catalytic subunit
MVLIKTINIREGGSTMTHAQELTKIKKEKRIADMPTRAIIRHLMYKHRVGLLTVTNMLTLAVVVSTRV